MSSTLTLNQYQEKALKTARYPKVGENLIYPTLGLIGEVGEVAELWATLGVESSTIGDNLLEYGDVLWYYATISHELGINLSDLLSVNHIYVDSFSGLAKVFSVEGTLWGDIVHKMNTISYKTMLTANIVKKIQRDDANQLTEEKRRTLVSHIADSFLAWAGLLVWFDIDLSAVAEENLIKLNG